MPNRSSYLLSQFLGLATGLTLGLGQIAFFRFADQWMHHPHLVLAFWPVVVAIASLAGVGIARSRHTRRGRLAQNHGAG